MVHPELFQQLLTTLNTYTSYSGSKATGTQHIALAKAVEALYSSVEGRPELTIQVDIDASVISSQELRERLREPRKEYKPDKPVIGFDSKHFIQDRQLRMIAD